MQLRYKLLDNNTGVLLTRQPQMVNPRDIFRMYFSDAPSGKANVIFDTESGVKHYEDLKNGYADVPIDKLEGKIRVTVATVDYTTKPKRWFCETIQITKENGMVLVAPDDTDIPDEIVKLKIENESIRKSLAEMDAKMTALNTRIDDVMNGYDIV